MAITVIDPSDGSSYDVLSDGVGWTIRENANGRPPAELQGRGPWQTAEHALKALRDMFRTRIPVHSLSDGPDRAGCRNGKPAACDCLGAGSVGPGVRTPTTR